MAKETSAPDAWQKPTVGFGLISFKVGIKNAHKEDKVQGHYYDATTHLPVKQQYVIQGTSKVVADKVTGYEDSTSDKPVFLTDEELEGLEVGMKGVVDLNGFAEESDVNDMFVDTTYVIWPDGNGQKKQFKLLMDALRDEGLVGVGTCCLTKSTRMVLVRYNRHIDYLVMQTCVFDKDIRWDLLSQAKSWTADGPEPSAAESEMARMYVAAKQLRVDFAQFAKKPNKYLDSFRAAIKAKAKGQKVKVGKPRPVVEDIPDLTEALKASLAQLDVQKKSAKKPGPSPSPVAKKKVRA